jgi:AcrR family transcriptional regulator
MARPKEFDREDALAAAIDLFAQRGFEGSSAADLVEQMGIGRQSIYDTFGSKRDLYLEALRTYLAQRLHDQIEAMRSGPTAFDGLAKLLVSAADDAAVSKSPACLGISAVCEFGRSDPEVTKISEANALALRRVLAEQVKSAQSAGDIASDLGVNDVAASIVATLTGIKVAARAGAPRDTLLAIARLAVRGLR